MISSVKTVLICGDSYSDNRNRSCAQGSLEQWSWVDLLSRDYEIKCIAGVGASNWDIWRQIDSQTAEYDLKIVNLTTLKRVNTYYPRLKMSDADQYSLNLQIARRIVKLPNTLCWSPFPEYEEMSRVHFIPLEQENELYNRKAKHRCTNHHFTREGNTQLYDWMKSQIEAQW